MDEKEGVLAHGPHANIITRPQFAKSVEPEKAPAPTGMASTVQAPSQHTGKGMSSGLGRGHVFGQEEAHEADKPHFTKIDIEAH